MSFFKTNMEKQMKSDMEREEQNENFDQCLNDLKSKRSEYVKIAATSEINGDELTSTAAADAILFLNEQISGLTRMKTNYDLINVYNSVFILTATAVNLLDQMAKNKIKLPNFAKIQKASLKLNNYMRNIKMSSKGMEQMMKQTNPANTSRTDEERAKIRPLIDAEIAKMTGVSTSSFKNAEAATAKASGLSAEIDAERNRII